MKLSELKTGETGVIVHVHGHGGFRKRIIEMGFIKGETIKVLLNAPLHDPVKYKVMDYEVSLRRAEAELVEVVNEEEAERYEAEHPFSPGIVATDCKHREKMEEDLMMRVARLKEKELTACFVGNPNCGKTSLFNIASGAHERVGNYSGVTVDAKAGEFDFEGYHFHLVDLPGTYSLTAYTPEELYVRKYIIEKTPDLIINVVDASNLERNLYLTAQLIDMDVPMIMALNMYDELRESGNQLDMLQLGTLLGVPIVPTVGRTGEGVKELFHQIIEIEEGRQKIFRHIHVNHGPLLEENIEKVEALIRLNPEPHHNYSGRFLAIKMLENDSQVEGIIRTLDNAEDIIRERNKCQQAIMDEIEEDSESAITDAKYGFVQGALKECYEKKHHYNRALTKRIDAVVTSHLWGYPIFLLLMYLMFYCTFNIGQYPMDWIDSFVGWLGESLSAHMADGPLKDLLVDGIIGGVGGVIVFLPNIMILYAFISWMEDSGYMARAAFIMDKIMHKMGLHGKSFIPMIMGFGCNIPAIMATRTIEDRKSRLITMLITPLMSCSARLPVYIIIIGAFFPRNSALVLFSLYLTGIIMSIFMAKLFSRFVVRGESSPFVMELPPYRLPSAKSVVRHTWEKGRQYLKKMGTTILAASIIVWALSYFPRHEELPQSQQMEHSYIGQIGKAVEPIIRPCGMEWKEGVSIITGIGAKEIVASTMGVLYSNTDTPSADEQLEDEAEENARLSRLIAKSGLTQLSAFAFLIFVLLYMPCIPACITIKHESGHWRWALFTIGYTTALAWLCSMLVYQLGSLL
ncbi:MAG: ferrous iron transport protein B [Bacteroidaceae bacterium]|nr:ferrous iron transport protein B [Bacteroidaceae bacterium]